MTNDVDEHGPEALVSIGMPVFNGDRYLRNALNCLLSQDFVDFEIVISDNASTDRTEEICLEYAENDARIVYLRNATNIGAAANFNQTFEMSRGKYFMWAAHDDEWAPTYLKQCVELLGEHPSAVLASSEIDYIDEEGASVAAGFAPRIDTLGMTVSERLHEVIRRYGWFDIYGLIRRDALAATQLYRNKLGGDVLLTFELLLHGDFVIAPAQLFRYRLPVRRKSVGELFQSITAESGDEADTTPHLTMARDLLAILSNSDLDERQQEEVRSNFVSTLGFENRGWRRKILHEQGLPSMWPYPRATIEGVFADLLLAQDGADQLTCDGVRQRGGLPMKAALMVEKLLLRVVRVIAGMRHAVGLSRATLRRLTSRIAAR